jgi:hypothetical protein
MWYKSEAATSPKVVDNTSSKKWVYVRKNIVTEQRKDETADKTYTVYVYDECKIPKDVYDMFEQQHIDSDRISDIEEVITEIIGGGIV